jgi:hypothetical protein
MTIRRLVVLGFSVVAVWAGSVAISARVPPFLGFQAGGSSPTGLTESVWKVTPGNGLTGITAATVKVIGVDATAQQCGVTNDSLQLAVARPLLDGSIRVASVGESVVLPSVEVNVTSLRPADGSCAATVAARLSEFTAYVPITGQRSDAFLLSGTNVGPFALFEGAPRSVKGSLGSVILLESGVLLTGRLLDFGQRLNDWTRRAVDDFVTQIKLASQK